MSQAPRGRQSIFGGLLLILVGVLFLLIHHLPQLGIGHLMRLYWPVILIVWGIAKLIDNFSARQSGDASPPWLSGGEMALIILLFVAVTGMWGFGRIRDQLGDTDSFSFNDMWVKKGVPVSEDVPPVAVKPNSSISVHTPRGDVTVFADEDTDMRIVATKTVSSVSDADSSKRAAEIKIDVTQVNGGFRVEPSGISGDRTHTRVDLEVHLPKQVSIAAQTDSGDITVTGISGAVTAISQSGDIAIHDVGSDVTAKMQNGEVRVAQVHGDIRLSGKGNGVELSDVSGSATIDGEFFGPIQVSNIAQTVQFNSSRTDLTILKMHGRLDLDSDSLQISDVDGGIKLKTHDKSIEIENATGRLDINDAHADVSITLKKPPSDEINVQNESGGIDLALPAKSSFEISANSRSGEIESEFDDSTLNHETSGDTKKLEGKVGQHGPKITLNTTYGTINVRKSES
jgi:Putative adhesin/Domain of unknown function (DUF5668)